MKRPRPSRAMTPEQKEERAKMRSVGLSPATRADFTRAAHIGNRFDEDGNLLSFEEKAAQRHERSKEIEQERLARKQRTVNAAANAVGAEVLSEITASTLMSGKFKFRCGCEQQAEFEATTYALGKAPAGKKPWCTMCRFLGPAARIKDILQKKGGELINGTKYVDSGRKLEVRCKTCKHEWTVAPTNLLSGSWCPVCAKRAMKDRYRLAMEEEAAERGFTLTGWAGKGKRIELYSPSTGHIEMLPNNFRGAVPRKGLRDIYIACDWVRNRGFAFAGELPPMVPETIADHLSRAEVVLFCEAERAPTKAIWGKLFESAILSMVDASRREFCSNMDVLNAWKNPQWHAPGIYTWGEVPPFHDTLVETPDLAQILSDPVVEKRDELIGIEMEANED